MKKGTDLIKKNLKKFNSFLKRYRKNNQIFCLYLLISMIELIFVRMLTTRTVLTLNPIFVDFGLITIYGSFSFIFKTHKKRYLYLQFWLILHTFRPQVHRQ